METQRTANPFQLIDYESSIKLIETKNIINNFFLDLCGLANIEKGENTLLKRVTRPKFTYEFAKDITTTIYIEVNRITARTTFGKEEVQNYIEKQCDTLADLFAVQGMRNLISDNAWEKILELGKTDPETITLDPETEQAKGLSFWESRHGIQWTYNDPVNSDMLTVVKKVYGLEEEKFGQDIILRNIFWSIRIFMHGGLNRSQDALTLNHEKVIHKESVVTNDNSNYREGEGMISRSKDALMRQFNIKK